MDTATRQLNSRLILSEIGKEIRPAQIQMGETIEAAIEKQVHAIIEAGTGTGKSFGYLIPAALDTNNTIVVSTANLALQDQLYNQDLPFLQKTLKERYGINLTFALLKGRSNFLCQERFGKTPAPLAPELREWATKTRTGDKQEIPFVVSQKDWAEIQADGDDCKGQKCSWRASCYYFIAKDRAKTAHVIITNHALVALDLKMNGVIIPDHSVLILDEAHQFEQYILGAWTEELKKGGIKKLINDTGHEFPDFKQHNLFEGPIDDEPPLAEKLTKAIDAMFKKVSQVGANAPDKYPINLADCREEVWSVVNVIEACEMFIQRNRDLKDEKHSRLLDRFGDLAVTLLGMSSKYRAAGNIITWIDTYKDWSDGGKDKKMIVTGPVSVAPILKERLFDGPFSKTVILTSATISAGGNFDFYKEQLGVSTTVEMVAASPFDYEKNSLLYIPRHIDPTMLKGSPDTQAQYRGYLMADYETLLRASKGHAFLLFTSRSEMNQAWEALQHLPYPMLKQGDLGKGATIQWFKDTPNAVLFALASFWEGVSIEGDDLRLVAINKLPFPAPGDPQRDAKAREMKARRQDPFLRMDVPETIIRLKQGFGRLIRTATDRGVVAILDSRIHTKPYGRSILASLPPAKLVTSLDDVDLAPYLS